MPSKLVKAAGVEANHWLIVVGATLPLVPSVAKPMTLFQKLTLPSACFHGRLGPSMDVAWLLELPMRPMRRRLALSSTLALATDVVSFLATVHQMLRLSAMTLPRWVGSKV